MGKSQNFSTCSWVILISGITRVETPKGFFLGRSSDLLLEYFTEFNSAVEIKSVSVNQVHS
jgi:hypothetical protein